MSAITLREVRKHYPTTGRTALDGVSLDIAGGEWVFLVGPSGAGKSTLLKLLYKAASPSAGSVRLDGRDIASVPAFLLRRRMGMIFQHFELLPNRTAAENIAYGAEVLGHPPGEVRERTREMLELVGLDEQRDSFPRELSGGEQQRVAIARALINRPRLILADEPTGDLDPANADRVLRALERVHRDWGATMIIVTHAVDVVNRFRRRVVRLEAGRVIRDEPGGYWGPEEAGNET